MDFKFIMEVCQTALAVLGFMYFYYVIYVLIGMFSTRKYPAASHLHKYAIVIAARNEENVIGQLLDSIRHQDYPGELTVFVVADNCTDSTAHIARDKGAVVYERFDAKHRTKGWAMQFLFDKIRLDYGNVFEAFIMLDADNLLKTDYISKMNNAFDSGEKIVTSYRNTKNASKNCIAASYALHWMRTCRCESRAKSVLHTSCRVQGTGFLFSSELVKEGWNYTDLTEDRTFCMDAVTRGYRVSYQDEAEFFDDQPESLKIAFKQRMRWEKGHLQTFSVYGFQLFVKTLKSIFADPISLLTNYDMFILNVPQNLFFVILKIAEVLSCIGMTLTVKGSPGLLTRLLTGLIISFILSCLGSMITAAYLMITERDRLPRLSFCRKLWYCITFPMFDIIGTITCCMAAFSKVEWVPTPHTVCAAALPHNSR